MYAIMGATGHVGSVIAGYFQQRNIPFRAIVRNTKRAEELEHKGISAVVAALDDATALTEAFAGTQGVFVMTPPLLELEDPIGAHNVILQALNTATRFATPGKIVYLSSIGGQYPTGTGAIRKLYDMEQLFKQLDVPTAGIRAGWFMENFLGQFPAIKTNNQLLSFIDPSSKQVSMVATKDIGLQAARLLQENWTGHRIIEVGGPCLYSCDDVAMVIGGLLSRSISVTTFNKEQYAGAYRSLGLTPAAAVLMSEMNVGFNTGHIVFEEKGTEMIHGEVLLEDFIKEHIQLLR